MDRFQLLSKRVHFWWMFPPAALAILGIAVLVYYYETDARLAQTRADERQHIVTATALLRQKLTDLGAQTKWLARMPALRRFASESSFSRRGEVESAFLALVEESGQFDQVRYLDENGNELVRISVRDGHAVVIPAQQRQNQARRYYFQGAMRQPPGTVYASRFDLNIEQGGIERPLKPVVRFATRVVDEAGFPRGLLVLNYLGDALRTQLRTVLADITGQAMLLNAHGYWLMSPDPAEEWGFMFENGPRFASQAPQVWRRLQGREGQFRADGSLYTYTTIEPGPLLGAAPEDQQGIGIWKLVSVVSAPNISSVVAPVARHVGFFSALGIAIALLLSLWFAHLRYERQRLRFEAIRNLIQAEEKQALLDLFIEHTPAAVAMLDRHMCYVASSRRWREEYGLTDEVLGRSHYEIFPHIPQQRREIHRRAMAGETIRADEEAFHLADGSVRWLRWEVRPWPRADGSVGGIVLMTEDVGARKQAARVREGFIANVSHELRTPVTALDGALKLLLDGVAGSLSDRVHMLVDTAHRNSTHLLGLVNDLLDLQKIKLGELDLTFDEVSITQLIDDMLAVCQPIAAQKRIRLVAEQHCDDPTLITDNARVTQVLTNLVSNAVRRTPEGMRVLMICECTEHEITCSVIDQGSGVPASFTTRVCGEFEQADTGDAHGRKGSGLGLAIARALIDRLGGRIGFENLPEGGARFYFILPRRGATS